MTDRITTSHEAPDVAELRRLLDECQPGRVIVNDLRPTHNAIWLDSRYDSGEWESLRTLAEIDTETETVEVLWGLNDAVLIAAALNALPYLLGAAAERDAMRRRLVAVEMCVEDALRHGYDLDPQEIASALAGALDATPGGE